jgi:hypothetical protein
MIVVCILFFLMAENVLFFRRERIWGASSNLTAVFKRAVALFLQLCLTLAA